MDYKGNIAKALSAALNIDEQAVLFWLEKPKNSEMGDVAFPCFRLSKAMRKAPQQIAAELSESLGAIDGIAKTEVVGGYLNFFANGSDIGVSILARIHKEGDSFGGSDLGGGRNVCVEFSSINIAKPFSFNHLPTTIIGNALYRIYKFLGYNAISINHLGDWGTQFGKMIYAYKRWGDKPIDEYSVRELVTLYVRYHEESENDKSMDDEARAWFHRLEMGDKEAHELWQKMKDVTLREDMVVYDRLGVHFDSLNGEAFYEDKMAPIIQELSDKGISKLDKGMEIVELSEWNMPPCIIVKSDGSTIYATRDLAAACYRKETYDFVKNIYVVAYQQDLHFKQFFKVLELMGRTWAKDCVHVNFGMVSMEGGTFSTRHGNVIYLDDVLSAAVEKTREIIEAKSPDLEDKDEVAEAIGVGAVMFSVLYNNRIKDVSFSWEKILNFEGESAPYLQYTHARCCSVLRKAGGCDFGNLDASALSDQYASALTLLLTQFPDAVKASAEKNEPYLVSRSIVAICAAFNKFYYEQRIMDDDPKVRNARLCLTDAVRQTVKNGLYLLGLKAPERM